METINYAFVTKKVNTSLIGEKNTRAAESIVLWTVDAIVQSWGIESLMPSVSKVIVLYDEYLNKSENNGIGVTSKTKEFTENIEVNTTIGTDFYKFFMPEFVVIYNNKNKAIVYF